MAMFPPSTRVLIADDAPSMRMTVKTILNGLGFTDITEAVNGANGWDLLNQASPPIQLILSDHNMPECTGLDFLKKVRADEKFKAVPFLLVTSEAEKQMIIDAIKAGVSNYVTKPLDAAALKKKLEAVAEKLGVK